MKLRLVAPPTATQADEPAGGFRYQAFLSYSHHDKVVARRLQQQLETYRVPRRLVGRETAHGVVPARLSPIFRDRDELHAGSDLKASVQEALAHSRWLIVVCTPDAARSPWVHREIVEFKKLHGERRVLALIVRGEPFASDTPGREAQECFPPALRRALDEDGRAEGAPLEPIAADLRRSGDGPRRATLKLVAGMLGVPFDELVRRELQRRVRWLTALAAASVAGVVVFAFLAVMAVQARNEAQYQREQAEGLIEFMLGDLRRKLEPVGRLEVLDAVGEKALGYYGGQDASRLDATALGHRARAMHLIGEIRDLRGQPAEAQQAFEQAAGTTARLLAQSPDDAQRIFDHAQSVFWVANAAWSRGEGKAAQRQFEEYLALSQRLHAMDGGNTAWKTELAYAHLNMGMVHLGLGRPEAALAALRTSAGLLDALAVHQPELKFELAHNHGWMSSAYDLLGEYESALAAEQKKLRLFDEMPGAATNRTAQRGVLSALNAISEYELAMGRFEAAEATVRRGLVIADKLGQLDPQNLFWRGDACFARLRLAHIRVAQGAGHDGAVRRALDCVGEFNASGSLGLRYTVMLTARALCLEHRVAGAQRGALDGRLRSFFDASMAQLHPDLPEWAKLTAEVANVGLALASSAARPAAERRALVETVRERLEPFASLNDGAVLTPLAKARLMLGDVEGAESLVRRLRSVSYRHPAFAELAKDLQAVRGGGKNLSTARS